MIKDIWINITRPFRRVYRRIDFLFYWIPIIWKDYDWDEYFLYKILQKKIHRMRRFFEFYGVAVHSKKEIRRMKTCELLLQRLMDEAYLDDFLDPTRYREVFPRDIGNWSPMRYRANYQGMHRKHIFDHEEYLVKQDLRLFCTLFQKYVRTWWD